MCNAFGVVTTLWCTLEHPFKLVCCTERFVDDACDARHHGGITTGSPSSTVPPASCTLPLSPPPSPTPPPSPCPSSPSSYSLSDFSKPVSSKGLSIDDVFLSHHHLTQWIDLRPFLNPTPYIVDEDMALTKASTTRTLPCAARG